MTPSNMTLIDHVILPRRPLTTLRRFLHRSRITTLLLFCSAMTLLAIYLHNSDPNEHGTKSWQAKIVSMNPLVRGSDSFRLWAKKSRVGKVSILYGNKKPAHERALKTHEKHNRLHGYPMYLLQRGILDGYWTKPAYILSLLLQELGKKDKDRLSWLFWVDADTVVLNSHIPLEIFIPPPEHKSINLLVSNDWNGLNNGIFLVAVTPWTVELFTAIISFRDFHPNTTLTFQDQSAMEFLLEEPKYANHTIRVPQRWFNAYKDEKDRELKEDQVRSGDLLVHLAGVNPREEFLDEWCDRYEENPSHWEIDLEKTTYPSEIKEFWEALKI